VVGLIESESASNSTNLALSNFLRVESTSYLR